MRKLSLWIFVFAAFSACPAGHAQTSTNLINSNLRAQYAAIKLAITKFQEPPPQDSAAIVSPQDEAVVALNPGCASDIALLVDWRKTDKATKKLAELAYHVWFITMQLNRFPRDEWEPIVRKFETAMLEHMVRHKRDDQNLYNRLIGRQLKQQLEAARQRDASLPAVSEYEQGGCAIEDIAITIATNPPGAQVLVIPTFFYELCVAQNLDPENPARCNRWREALQNKRMSVIGDYRYQARWPDGAFRRGMLSINEIEKGTTITLDKP